MKIPIFPGKYHQNAEFSMAMLVYRRIYTANNPGVGHCYGFFRGPAGLTHILVVQETLGTKGRQLGAAVFGWGGFQMLSRGRLCFLLNTKLLFFFEKTTHTFFFF